MNRAIDKWSKQRAGTDCYLCMPRVSSNTNLRKIASLSASSLHLIEDQRFLGHSTLVFDDRHATTLEELSDDEYMRYSQDLRLSTRSIRPETLSEAAYADLIARILTQLEAATSSALP